MIKENILKLARQDSEFRQSLIQKLSFKRVGGEKLASFSTSKARKILDQVENMIIDPISEGEFDFGDPSNKRVMARLGVEFGNMLGALQIKEEDMSMSSQEERIYDEMNEIYDQMDSSRFVMKPFLTAVDNTMSRNYGL